MLIAMQILLPQKGVLCLFRSFTILVTTLPDPSPRCQLTDRPLRKWYELFNPVFSETCGNLSLH